MRRHKMVIEAEFYVDNGEDVETEANQVVADVLSIIDASGDSSSCVVAARIISFDEEPLPQTEKEIAEDKAEAEAEVVRVAEVDAFIKKTPLRSPIGLQICGSGDLFGTLLDAQPFHISVLVELGITMVVPRDVIDKMWIDDGADDEGAENAAPAN